MLAPVICLSHGGGPLPVLNDPSHKSITTSLKHRIPTLLNLNNPNHPPPQAIILLTAHWTTPNPTISSSPKHSLLYDYHGFPPQAYTLTYPAPGSPQLAQEIHSALQSQNFSPKLDPERGWDHGLFIPLLLSVPKANIPIIQLSVLSSESPEAHFRLGAAISSLRAKNVAILGSGFASFHNLGKMRQLMASPDAVPGFKQRSDEWNAALSDAVGKKKRAERLEALAGWRELPHAYEMHPRGGAEHFMPLLACAGAAGDEEAGMYKDEFLGVDIFTYYWGTEL